jgi:hypothetical protein
MINKPVYQDEKQKIRSYLSQPNLEAFHLFKTVL